MLWGQYENAQCSMNCGRRSSRSEEHTSELQSHSDLVCRLLLEKKKTKREYSATRLQATKSPTSPAQNTQLQRVNALAMICFLTTWLANTSNNDMMLSTAMCAVS